MRTVSDTARSTYLESARNEFVEVSDATEDELVRLPSAITANDREIRELSSLQQPVGRISFSECVMRANRALSCTSDCDHTMPLGLSNQWEIRPSWPNLFTVCLVACVKDGCMVGVWAMKPQRLRFVGIAGS